MKKIFTALFIVALVALLTGCRWVKTEKYVKVREESIPTEVTGDDLDLSKIKLDVEFEDGTKGIIELNEKMLVNSTLSDLRKPGTHNVRVVYKDVFLNFELTVLEEYPPITVKFVAKGKTFEDTVEEREIEKHTEVGAMPQNSEVEGYLFEGWYLEPYYQTYVTPQTVLDDNCELYGKYVPYTFDVTFNYGDKTVTEKVIYGDNIYFFPTFNIAEEDLDGYYVNGIKIDATTEVVSNLTVEVRTK